MRRARWMLAFACIAYAFHPTSIDATSSSGGSLVGQVEIGSELTARRMHFELYGTPGGDPARATAPAESTEIQNVVVYLEAVPFTPGTAQQRERPKKLVIAQQGERFVPHVLPVMKGDTVEFPNLDPVFHNVFSLSATRTFDLGRYPRPSSKGVRFDRPGVVKVFCHIHSDMSSVVYVLDNPYFTVPDGRGHFELSGIPPGQYRLVAWHERARPATQMITIAAGGTAEATLRLPYPDGKVR